MARNTHVYTNPRGRWITAFAPILDSGGRVAAVVKVDYPVEIYLTGSMSSGPRWCMPPRSGPSAR